MPASQTREIKSDFDIQFVHSWQENGSGVWIVVEINFGGISPFSAKLFA